MNRVTERVEIFLACILFKSETAQLASPNISKIIELQENGGGGGNITQILYFPFYMGIAP